VWAFEPNPENYRCARITVDINGFENVELKNAGLGKEEKKGFLTTRSDWGGALGGGSSFVDSGRGQGEEIEVEVVRIDDVVPTEREVALVQLDVEGYEEEALRGGIETIRRCRPTLILESTPTGRWMSENILDLGYERVGWAHHNAIFATG